MPNKPTKLTKSAIDALEPKATDYIVWDGMIAGFGVKVTPAGKKVALLQYRFNARTRKLTIGTIGSITIDQARKIAEKQRGEVANGNDPAAEKLAKRREATENRLADHFATYEAEKLSQRRTGTEVLRIFKYDVLPVLGSKPITAITRAEVISVVTRVKSRGSPTAANRTFAEMRSFFSWLVGRGVLDKSPVDGLRAQGSERKRERFLSDDELSRVLKAARSTPFPYGAIVLLLAYTGQRLNEVAGMRWDELNLDDRTWTIPASRAKNGKAHIVHLAAPVMDVIRALPNTGSLVVSLSDDQPFSGWSKAKRALDGRSKTSDWTHHDLRRTMVTGMAGAGIAPYVADRILNHVQGTISGVAAVYQKHDFLLERKAALDLWASRLMELEHAS